MQIRSTTDHLYCNCRRKINMLTCLERTSEASNGHVNDSCAVFFGLIISLVFKSLQSKQFSLVPPASQHPLITQRHVSIHFHLLININIVSLCALKSVSYYSSPLLRISHAETPFEFLWSKTKALFSGKHPLHRATALILCLCVCPHSCTNTCLWLSSVGYS